VLEIGPLTIHFYALSILTGIAVAIWIGRRRYKAIGGNPEDISEAALWAVPAGIIGGRIYHVITSPQKYFGEGGNPIDALKIWQGGLGIWGAISLGAVGAYLYYRTHQTSHSFSYFLDALAPGVALAQAIGRIGNWFNIELFGSPTTLPWGLEVPPFKRPAEFSEFATFHPTFLYELIWCTALALFLMKLPKFISTRFSNPGDLFVIYVLGYTVGRLWIEVLRVDTATLILGLRFNIWISLLVLLSAMTYLYKSSRNLKKNPTN
jgi:prolipoprotein diacylglyceryl transferase